MDDKNIHSIDPEPDWKPLKSMIDKDQLANFMHMGRIGTMQMYKHQRTRRYINIDAITGYCFQYSGGEYRRIERDSAIAYVLERRSCCISAEKGCV